MDLDFSLLMRLGDGVSGEELRDLEGGGDRERERDLDPGGLLLREGERIPPTLPR